MVDYGNKLSIMDKLIIGIILFLTSISCSKDELKDDELVLSKKAYLGNQLRVDGYFYQKKDNIYSTVYLFYRNGVVLYVGGGYSEVDLLSMESSLIDGSFYNLAKSDKLSWGVHNISGNSIAFERWYPSNRGGFPSYVRSGEILNDSTFHISKSIRFKELEVNDKNETYHFKQFSHKPDSTNSFAN